MQGRDRGGGRTGVEEEGGRIDGFFETAAGFRRDVEELEYGVEDARFVWSLEGKELTALFRGQGHGLVEEFFDTDPTGVAHRRR